MVNLSYVVFVVAILAAILNLSFAIETLPLIFLDLQVDNHSKLLS